MSGSDRWQALRRDDARARRRAREEFARPLVLEAGAGTGKTTALVTRVVVWCLGPGWERGTRALAEGRGAAPSPESVAARVLQRVVAITFTDAAAAKMGEEIAAALLRVERGDLPGWLPESALPHDPSARALRARALRGALDHLAAQTIHAWCRRLLAAHPLEAGLHPRLEIDADQRRQEEIVREVLEERLGAAYSVPGSAELGLAARGQGPLELELELLALLDAGLGAADLARDPLAADRLEALRLRLGERLEAFFAAGGGSLRQATRARKSLATVEGLERLRERLHGSHWPGVAALDAFVAELDAVFPKKLGGRLAEWAGGAFGSAEEEAIGRERDDVVREAAALAPLLAHLRGIDAEQLALARRVLHPLLDEVERRMRARGVISFSALLSGAQELLRGHRRVAAQVRRGIDQLLVDEFQDTDRRQCDILRAVALVGPEDSRPGLFLVGDPKQSIYGWRSADLAAYDAFVDEVLAAGGGVERLSVNFRSVPAVLDEVERAIAPVMQREPGLQPGFEPLAPSPAHERDPGHREGGRAPVEYWAAASWDAAAGQAVVTRAVEGSRLEARALARDLVALRESGVAWGSIGVLFRGRADFELYLSELRAAHVPYAVEGDRSYYQRREVIEAAALVRSVLDPNDHLALVTVLRSALVGVPDAALLPLWQQGFAGKLGRLGGPGPTMATLGSLLDEVAASLPSVPGLDRVQGWERNARAFCEAVAHLRVAFREEPADRFVEKLRGLSLFEATEAARYLGAWRVANLDRFFRELAVQLAEEGDAFAALRRLRRAVSEEEQREEGVPQDLAEEAVQILTIHGAKGLDFAHVYVMQLHKGAGRAPRPGIDPGEHDGQVEYRLFGAPTPAWDRIAVDRGRVEAAERVRTLYVAMTRAEQRLVMSGVWPALQRSPRSDQAVAVLQARAAGLPDLPALMAEVAADGEDARDVAEARWVFPALREPTAPAARRSRSDAGLPSAGACAQAAAALRASRHEASAREARPFAGAASAAAHEPGLGSLADRRFGDEGGRAAPGASGGRAGAVSRAVGTVAHRVLEVFDLRAEPEAELARQQALLPGLVAGVAEEAVREEVLSEAASFLVELSGGQLLARLRALAGAIVARELPVLRPAAAARGPAGFVSGKADLVYRDPDSGRLVVVDYKTDHVEDRAQAEARSGAYLEQGAVYQEALREGLGLDYTPRFELWYLRADLVLAPDAPSTRSA